MLISLWNSFQNSNTVASIFNTTQQPGAFLHQGKPDTSVRGKAERLLAKTERVSFLEWLSLLTNGGLERHPMVH